MGRGLAGQKNFQRDPGRDQKLWNFAIAIFFEKKTVTKKTPDLPRDTCATLRMPPRSAAPTVPFCLICKRAFSGVNWGTAGTGFLKTHVGFLITALLLPQKQAIGARTGHGFAHLQKGPRAPTSPTGGRWGVVG